MVNNLNLLCVQSIAVSEPQIKGKAVTTQIEIEDLGGKKSCFMLQAKYPIALSEEDLPLLRLAGAMPLLNYGLFADEIRLNYPVSEADYLMLKDLLDIFSKDILINKFVRRKNPYILPQYVPTEGEITEENAKARAKIIPKTLTVEEAICKDLDSKSCGVLSSGGKESLLTYAMLKETGANVYPIYVNESGGHWRTAIAAYRYHQQVEPNTMRVWLNVDRLYVFMLDHLKIIRSDHRKVWLDTYPIRLCIFPVYVFYLLPVFAAKGIGNLLIGNEFDDPRSAPDYKGIKHYFGVYDQTQDYDLRMEQWYQKCLPGMRQWSAVRPISGLIVERILTQRYPQIAAYQRSCHSCCLVGSEVVPCGECSKCIGIQLFLQANRVSPLKMNYSQKDIELFPKRFFEGGLRLDEDEKEHAAYLCSRNKVPIQGKEHAHVESIHLYKQTGDLALVPEQFRPALMDIIERYTNGYSELACDQWFKASKQDSTI